MDYNYLTLAVPTLLFALAAHQFREVDLPDIIKEYLCRVCPLCYDRGSNNRELLELSLVEMDEIKEQLIELTDSIQDFIVRNPDIFSRQRVNNE